MMEWKTESLFSLISLSLSAVMTYPWYPSPVYFSENPLGAARDCQGSKQTKLNSLYGHYTFDVWLLKLAGCLSYPGLLCYHVFVNCLVLDESVILLLFVCCLPMACLLFNLVYKFLVYCLSVVCLWRVCCLIDYVLCLLFVCFSFVWLM